MGKDWYRGGAGEERSLLNFDGKAGDKQSKRGGERKISVTTPTRFMKHSCFLISACQHHLPLTFVQMKNIKCGSSISN